MEWVIRQKLNNETCYQKSQDNFEKINSNPLQNFYNDGHNGSIPKIFYQFIYYR